MKLFPNLRNILSDIFPAILIVIFAAAIGIANVIGALNTRGPLQTSIAWFCTLYLPYGLYVFFKNLRLHAVIADQTGIRWSTIDRRGGFVRRSELAAVELATDKRVTVLRMQLVDGEHLDIPVQVSGHREKLERELNELLGLPAAGPK